MSIEPHDGDLSKGIGLNVEVYRPRAEPFVQSPLIARVQMDCKISSILLGTTFLCEIHRFIIESFPGETYAGNGAGRQKFHPRSNAPLPPPAFGSPAHSRQETKGRLNHVRHP